MIKKFIFLLDIFILVRKFCILCHFFIRLLNCRDFKLLSFGEEAEEDEEEFKELNKKFSGKSKSAHDVLDDPKLSSEPALEQASSSKKRKNSDSDDEGNEETPEEVQKRR